MHQTEFLKGHGFYPNPNAVRQMRQHGIGVGYRYPHDYEGADVEQQHLPDRLVGRRYYEPSDQGFEQRLGERLARLRSTRTGTPGGPSDE